MMSFFPFVCKISKVIFSSCPRFKKMQVSVIGLRFKNYTEPWSECFIIMVVVIFVIVAVNVFLFHFVEQKIKKK